MSNILLVDDEPLMINLLELYLKPHGYTCLLASSGKEALNYLHTESVSLVIMDVMMAGRSGWEIAMDIRAFSDIPIVMLTARDQAEDILKSINCGANSHICKPIDEKKLLLHVESLLAS